MRKSIVLLCLALGWAQAQAQTANANEHWVTSWTTAQQLVVPTGPPRPARQKGPEASNLPASLAAAVGELRRVPLDGGYVHAARALGISMGD